MSARRRIVLAFVLLALGVPRFAGASQSKQQSLAVHVIDPAGNAVPDATVVATTRDSRTRWSGTSDSDGYVEVVPIAADYVIEVSAPGFAIFSMLVQSDSGIAGHAGWARGSISARRVIEARLAIAPITDRVVVTASGDQQAPAEVSKAVGVVDGAEIDARGEFSVAEAVRTVAGTTVQQLGGPGAFASIRLRGLREQDTALLIDGVRFRDAASPQGDATAFIGDLYVASIDRIEVLRGSGSSLYGSHAVGGVVNVITRQGGGPAAGDLVTEAGGDGFVRSALHLGGGAWGDRFRYNGGAAHVRADGLDANDQSVDTSVQARGDVRLFGSAQAMVRGYLSDATSFINEPPVAIRLPTLARPGRAVPLVTFKPPADDPDSTRDSSFTSTVLRLQQRPGAHFGYTTSVHRVTTKRTFVDGPEGTWFEPVSATRSDYEGLVHTFESRADVEWSARHVTTIGYEFERERYVSRSIPSDPATAWRADVVQDAHAFLLQQQMRFSKLQLASGFRLQRFSMRRPSFDPAGRAPFASASFTPPPSAVTGDVSAARWLSTAQMKLWAHAGNGYRAPSIFERAGAWFDGGRYAVYGDPRLGPERSIAADAGIEMGFERQRVHLAATLFTTRLTRVIAFGSVDVASDPFGRDLGYRNADGRRASGVELSVRLNPTPVLRVNVSYTFIDAQPPKDNREGLPRAAALPAHQLSALVVGTVGSNLHLSGEIEAAGEHYAALFDPVTFQANAYRFDRFVKCDLAATYEVRRGGRVRLRVHAQLDNLFGRIHYVQGFPTPGRIARAGATMAF